MSAMFSIFVLFVLFAGIPLLVFGERRKRDKKDVLEFRDTIGKDILTDVI